MNRWDCDVPGCSSAAVGCGGAIGLRAIGWYFREGPVILCPSHRPDPIPCTESGDNTGESCSLCAAEREAEARQALEVTDDEDH